MQETGQLTEEDILNLGRLLFSSDPSNQELARMISISCGFEGDDFSILMMFLDDWKRWKKVDHKVYKYRYETQINGHKIQMTYEPERFAVYVSFGNKIKHEYRFYLLDTSHYLFELSRRKFKNRAELFIKKTRS